VGLQQGLKVIGVSAFADCDSLTRISIPSSVEIIHESAFFRYRKLVDVELRQGLQTIGERAFHLCISMSSLFIPASTALGLLALLLV